MTEFLIRHFIKDYQDVEKISVRTAYGVFASIVGIFCNVLLFIVKFIVGLVLQWLKELGGVPAIYERNREKAALLYDFLDQSRLFRGTVRREFRSLMNVPFVTGSEELDKKFVAEAKAAGLVNLKGHRTVGGMRASIYNAMPLEGVRKLVDFMAAFEKENG